MVAFTVGLDPSVTPAQATCSLEGATPFHKRTVIGSALLGARKRDHSLIYNGYRNDAPEILYIGFEDLHLGRKSYSCRRRLVQMDMVCTTRLLRVTLYANL